MKTIYYFKKINLLYIGLMLALTTIVNTNIFSQPTLLGMTSQGGDGSGVIFGLAPGNLEYDFQYNFPVLNPGNYPKGLIQASNGKLYGTTMFGGKYGYGVLFEYNIVTNTYIKKFDFNGLANGKNPSGNLIQAENGKLYGMTSTGGVYDYGVIFEYDILYDICIKKIDFNGKANGAKPYSSLMIASDGRLYGTTSSGGDNDDGVLFQYDYSSNSLTKKFDFLSNSSGAYPNGNLIEGSIGKLYGMAAEGGSLNKGVIYEYNITNSTYTKKIDFDGANGRNPYNNSLMKALNGKLYGLTITGGLNDLGVLFEYDAIANSYSKKIDFGGSNYGSSPIGALLQADNGKLYGANVYGGAKGFGVMFEYDIDAGNLTSIIDFIASGGVSDPANLLTKTADGKIYGITSYGGVSNKGILFEFDLEKSLYTKKIDFMDRSDGASPYGSLISARNGRLYGLTMEGGVSGMGTLFEYDMFKNALIKKFDFDGTVNGANPYGSLLQASNGRLYGLTPKGGLYASGVLFEYDPELNVFIKKMNFTGNGDGKKPYGSLMEAANGKLYGMTNSGGSSNIGVLFEYDYANELYTKKLDFEGIGNGGNPWGNLIEVENGKLYGMTSGGGINHFGILFEYDYNANYLVKKVDFDGATNGRYPLGSLIKAANGKLYGMTSEGGAYNLGVLFEYDPKTNSIINKFDFSLSSGSNPRGSLMQSSNGKLYGMTSYGGANNLGVLFEYDLKTDTYSKKIDFNAVQGGNPNYGNLIEVISTATNLEIGQQEENSFQVFPNPASDLVEITCNKPLGNVLVLNSMGQVIIQKDIVDNTTELDLRKFADGVYYIRVQQHEAIINKKIIKH